MTKPFKYQKRGVRIIDQEFDGRAMLADEMGLGKSFQALMYADLKPDLRPIIIVCPASAKWHWEKEVKTHINKRAAVLEGRKPNRIAPHVQILIINWDILKSWLPTLRKLKPKLIILDEIQNIKTRGIQRTEAARELCIGKRKKIIGLSGTPMTGKPNELYPFLNIILPDLFSNYWQFVNEFCIVRPSPWGRRIVRAKKKAAKRLHRLLKAVCMVRRLQKDVLKDLPSKRRIVIPLEISNRREYNKAKNDFITAIKEAHQKGESPAKTMGKGTKLRQLIGELKLASVIEWLQEYERGTKDKLIIYGIHRAVLKTLHKKFPNSVLVTGETIGKKRQRAFDQFSHDHKTRFLFGNIVAAGTAWNGIASPATAHIEFSWLPTDHAQAEKRVHRIGQKRKTRAYYLVAKDTMEDHHLEILQTKQRSIDAIMDGNPQESDLNVYDQLCRELMHTNRRKK